MRLAGRRGGAPVAVAGRVALALGLIAVALTVAPSPAGAEGDLGPLERCVADKGSLSALFLMDTSASLKRTDPGDERVGAVQTAIRSLGSLVGSTRSSDDPFHLYVDFLEFGSTTRRAFPDLPRWSPVPADTTPLEQLAATFGDRDSAEDTDYVAALEPWHDRADPARPADEIGAVEMLAAAPAGTCRVLAWFTDGQLDIDFQGGVKTLHWDGTPLVIDSEAAEAPAEVRARDVLCRPGGAVDALRGSTALVGGDATFVAAVAFGDQDFDLMRSMAVGSGAGGACGQRPAAGAFLAAADMAELSEQLRVALLGTPDAAVGGVATCLAASRACQDVGELQVFDFPFRLDESLTAFNLLTVAGNPAVEATLITPTGQQLVLGASATTTLDDGVVITAKEVADTVHQVSAVLPEGRADWAGQWRVRYRTADAAAAQEVQNRASIYVFGSLEARVRPGPALRRGRASSFVVELVGATGQPKSDLAFPAGSELVVSDPAGHALDTPTVASDGSFAFSYDVPADLAADALSFTARLVPRVQVADGVPALELPVWEGTLGPVEVRALPGYPLVDPPSSLATLDKDHLRSTGVLVLDAAGPEAGGCISVVSLGTTSLPEGMTGRPRLQLLDGERVLEAGGGCALTLPAGSQGQLTLSVGLDADQLRVQDGLVEGTVVLRSTSTVDPAESEDFTYSFGARVEPNVIIGQDAPLAAALVALALLGPLALLYLFNWLWAARLDAVHSVVADLDVALVGSTLLRVDGATGAPVPFALTDDDLRPVFLPDRQRRVPVDGVTFRARVSWWPFGEAVGRADASSYLVVSRKGTTRRGRRGDVGLSLVNAWALRVERDELVRVRAATSAATATPPEVRGRLLLLVPPPPDAARRTVERLRGEIALQARLAIDSTLLHLDVAPPTPVVGDGPAAGSPDGRGGDGLPGAPGPMPGRWGSDDDLPGAPQGTGRPGTRFPSHVGRRDDGATPARPRTAPDDDLPR